MNLEFHYYINYLIALKAGFDVGDAYKIAYSAQQTDDNLKSYKIHNKTNRVVYRNSISQCYDLKKSTAILRRIHTTFHFVPGDFTNADPRRDGMQHKLCTTPNCFLAKRALRVALESNDLYWIGVASHAYADTWAHQNFTGTKDKFNGLKGFPQNIIPNIGHADVLDKPDRIDLVWQDTRLVDSKVVNKNRFLETTTRLFIEYRTHLDPDSSRTVYMCRNLIHDLSEVIGKPNSRNYDLLGYKFKKRVKAYNRLAEQYSLLNLIDYDPAYWRRRALSWNGFRYKWKHPRKFKESDWYKFQQAVKKHEAFIWPLIKKRIDSTHASV